MAQHSSSLTAAALAVPALQPNCSFAARRSPIGQHRRQQDSLKLYLVGSREESRCSYGCVVWPAKLQPWRAATNAADVTGRAQCVHQCSRCVTARCTLMCVQFACLLLALHVLLQGVVLCMVFVDAKSTLEPVLRATIAAVAVS